VPLTDAEIAAALATPDELQAAHEALESPVVPEIVTPQYRRSQRQPGDSTSRIGVSIGACDSDIKVTDTWAFHIFCLPYPTVIGRVSAGVDLSYPEDYVEVRLFNASGDKILQARLTGKHGSVSASFDEIRLAEGDYIVCFRAPGSPQGRGSYGNPHTGLFGSARFGSALPERPILDTLLSALDAPIRIGMPQLRFSAD
jgi:hypothetical protein